jgi:hypothetical protein
MTDNPPKPLSDEEVAALRGAARSLPARLLATLDAMTERAEKAEKRVCEAQEWFANPAVATDLDRYLVELGWTPPEAPTTKGSSDE